jgi:hypothetical protein
VVQKAHRRALSREAVKREAVKKEDEWLSGRCRPEIIQFARQFVSL